MNSGTALLGRLLVLLPMAFCIALILASDDRMVRLAAVLGLVLLEQAREWVLFSGLKATGKDNKR